MSEQFSCKTLIDAEWSREDADDGWELVVWMGSSQLDALDQSWRYSLYIFFLDSFTLSLSLFVFTFIWYVGCHLPRSLAHLYLNGTWSPSLVFELYTFCWILWEIFEGSFVLWPLVEREGRRSCFVLDYPSVRSYLLLYISPSNSLLFYY